MIERSRCVAVRLLVVVLGVLAALGGEAAPEGSPSKEGAIACAGCHAREHESWRASRHAAAFDNDVFQADFARHRRAWCVRCHAPDVKNPAAVARGAPDERTSDGVSCRSCHVVSSPDGIDTVLSAHEPSPQGLAAHPMRHAPELKTPAACARCHQFDVVDPSDARLPAGDLAMQDTVREHRSSSYFARGVSCQRCHMPQGGHGFPGAHDDDFVRASVSARVTRELDGSLVAEVRTTSVGHRFPTGDLSRRLVAEACADEECTRVLSRALFYRRVERQEGRFVLVEDTTVPAPSEQQEPVARVPLSSSSPAARFWRLVYVLDDKGSVRREIARGDVVVK